MYGPTETTIWSLIARVHPGSGAVPIGRPIANTTVHILDAQGQPVPAGVPGKLYIGGEGVALGYKNRPQLTSQMFIANPLPEHGGERIYDTGDLASYRADGSIEWLGRVDRQVKIHGHRIEPEEIESVLIQHTGVSGAVVAVRARADNDKRLIAYILPAGSLVPSSSEMRSHCETFLPDYMVPSAFLFVDAFPMTPNGKVDRNALPEPDRVLRRGSLPEHSGRETIPPRTPLETTLLRIFEQILMAGPVCVTDDFFDSGGTSLLAAQLVLSIEKQTGHNLPVAALFQASTVRQLAQMLQSRSYVTAWSPLVELRRGGSGADPLFCIHWLDAKLVTFHKIASLLREDRTVYGLQPHSRDGTAEPPHSIKEMAAVYLREIRLCRPHGPYHLAGSCLGGVVAFEIAQQLIAAGEQVELLLLIDAFMPGPLQYLHKRPYLVEQVDQYAGEFLLSPFAALKRWLQESAVRITVRVRGNSSSVRPAHPLRQITRRAEAEYRPRPYSGKITLLICSDASCRAYEDRRLAWSSVAAGGFEVYVVPGNHSTMEQEPNIQVIGEQLQRCFDRLDRKPSAYSISAR
jgi:thioesterase domain-containing protein/acyl carrier protein